MALSENPLQKITHAARLRWILLQTCQDERAANQSKDDPTRGHACARTPLCHLFDRVAHLEELQIIIELARDRLVDLPQPVQDETARDSKYDPSAERLLE